MALQSAQRGAGASAVSANEAGLRRADSRRHPAERQAPRFVNGHVPYLHGAWRPRSDHEGGAAAPSSHCSASGATPALRIASRSGRGAANR
ncbi:hypothetical protein GCM10007320_57540 [Pseudorhodoferax aquiterrae]|uniref:Uncharacterized protein n=1 Tax=Pseudorhodoferax aquiterrae TaxID=747304 RepID=A0ABQ3GCE3_9BURK|nr:hypothetical protein GCM10007320_57540 [Pseudorhodoferax aquiterrae]